MWQYSIVNRLDDAADDETLITTMKDFDLTSVKMTCENITFCIRVSEKYKQNNKREHL